MKLSLMTSINIYWDESASYILVYGIYALVACTIIVYVENRLLQSNVELGKLIFANASVLLLAIFLFAISLFIGSWLSHLLGGEIVTILVTVIVSLLVIYALKMFFINHFDFQFQSPIKVSSLTSLILFAPYIIFNVFIFVLGSAFKN